LLPPPLEPPKKPLAIFGKVPRVKLWAVLPKGVVVPPGLLEDDPCIARVFWLTAAVRASRAVCRPLAPNSREPPAESALNSGGPGVVISVPLHSQ